MSLFQRKHYRMASGGLSEYHIDCSALDDEDVATLAWLVSTKGAFRAVAPASQRGRRFADALQAFCGDDGVRLIVDDVLTTGETMEAARSRTGWSDALGVVLFARGPCPGWVLPLFSMQWINTRDRF